jgi:3-hydroxyisobutyrate dehydrogenase-like beta-hydroxyacid dehydrogenase
MTDRPDTAGSPIATVGFVGLGRMGLPMTRHVLGGGFPVVGFDLDAAAVRAAEALGARPAASCAEVAAEADLVLVIVPTDDDVLAACCGPDGAIATARPGSVIAVCSHARPETTVRIDADAAARGIGVLDAQLTMGVHGAEAGTMTLLVGGREEDLDRARPVFACFAPKLHHLGPVGSGQVAKAVNNLLLWAHLAAAAEALDFGARHGLDADRLRTALLDCSAESWVLNEIHHIQPTWRAKDMKNTLAMAADIDHAMPLAERIAEVIGRLDRAALDAILAPEND